MNYKMDIGCWNSIFAVPTEVVDKYMRIASGSSIKTLLYLLRYSGSSIDSAQVSQALSISEEDVRDAFVFWEQVGLIAKNDNVYIPSSSGVSLPVVTEKSREEEISEEQARMTAVKTAALRSPHFSPVQISDTVKGDDEIRLLFNTCEGLYGRPLKHTEQNAIVTIVDEIGLPSEVALMLVSYCFSVDRPTPAFMKSMAVEWMENGITTLLAAEEYINTLQAKFGAENIVKSVFGINNRALTQKEKDFAVLWVKEWGFNAEIIRIAYDINVNAKGKFTFPYISKILENWHQKGLHTKESIMAEQENRQSGTGVKSSFDTNEIDNIILDDYM